MIIETGNRKLIKARKIKQFIELKRKNCSLRYIHRKTKSHRQTIKRYLKIAISYDMLDNNKPLPSLKDIECKILKKTQKTTKKVENNIQLTIKGIKNSTFDINKINIPEKGKILSYIYLGYISKTLLNKEIKSYQDIVGKNKTFLDLPLNDLANYACEDADITLQLYKYLIKEMKRKKIYDNFLSETMLFLKSIIKYEINGIDIDYKKYLSIRKEYRNTLDELKQNIYKKIGKQFNIDSLKEITIILKGIPKISEFICTQQISSKILEELAISHNIPKLLLMYRKLLKDIKVIDKIDKKIKNGKLFLSYNFVKTPNSQIESEKPNIFESNNKICLKTCFTKDFQDYFPDVNKSLNIISFLSKDGTRKNDVFKKEIPFLNEFPTITIEEFFKLVLYIVIGYSNIKLSKLFLLDQLNISTLIHKILNRYKNLSVWLTSIRNKILKQGYVIVDNQKKYFAGLSSASLSKRNKSLISSMRSLIKY